MWNAVKNGISRDHLKEYHLLTLRHAVLAAWEDDIDVRTVETYEALDWLENNMPRNYGLVMFKHALEKAQQPCYMIQSYNKILRYYNLECDEKLKLPDTGI
jgi:hypothetical protein